MGVRSFLGAASALVFLSGCATTSGQYAAQGGPKAPFSCADELSLSEGGVWGRQLVELRDFAPSAGGRADASLAKDADHAIAAYDMFNTFDAGGAPGNAFDVDGYGLIGLIYGNARANTERSRSPERARTFYGYVASNLTTGDMLVAFRGSMEPADWVRNMQSRQVDLPFDAAGASAQVHNGFSQIYETLEFQDAAGATPFSTMLASGVMSTVPVRFVGHSLGGALANLAAVELVLRQPSAAGRIEVTTLGAPRVGDEAFAEIAESISRNTRVCNLADSVPDAPLSTPFNRYVHAGDLRRYSSFDYPQLANDLEQGGEQIGCWHRAKMYRLMLDPNSYDGGAPECLVGPGS